MPVPWIFIRGAICVGLGTEVPHWSPGAKQFADTVYRFWPQKLPQFENFAQFTSFILDHCFTMGLAKCCRGVSPWSLRLVIFNWHFGSHKKNENYNCHHWPDTFCWLMLLRPGLRSNRHCGSSAQPANRTWGPTRAYHGGDGNKSGQVKGKRERKRRLREGMGRE